MESLRTAAIICLTVATLTACGRTITITEYQTRICPAKPIQSQCKLPAEQTSNTLRTLLIETEQNKAIIKQCQATLTAWRKAWESCSAVTDR